MGLQSRRVFVSMVNLAKPMDGVAQLEDWTDWLGRNDMSSPLSQCPCLVLSTKSGCERWSSSGKHQDDLHEVIAGLEIADSRGRSLEFAIVDIRSLY